MEDLKQNDSAFLSLKHLEKVYAGGEKAVHDFNLEIGKNEFIVFVGPSGCGKSTTLRMIAGLEDVTSGEIYLQGEFLNYKPSSERKMALVFQSYALYPQMNVYENIAFPLTINKYPMPVVNKTLAANAEAIKLSESLKSEKFIGAVYNVFHGKGSRKQKEEDLATVFGSSIETAKLLLDLFAGYKNDSLESLLGKEREVLEKLAGEIRRREQDEKRVLGQNGVLLNDDFFEVDKNGRVKIEYRKYTPYEIKTRVYETAGKLDLTPYLDKLPKELSGGQMQRVALGRAIIKNVPVFLMDEPLSNLDAKLRLTMRSEIVKLHNKIGATTIYVTHDQTEAMTMATRIVVMSKGFVQQIGTPEEVYNHPANIFVARFIGAPAMNIFDLGFDRENKRLVYGDLSIPVTDEFIGKHDALYTRLIEEFGRMSENFDAAACERINKYLSVTGESANRARKNKRDNTFFAKIKGLLAKIKKRGKSEKQAGEKYSEEQEICKDKLQKLIDCAAGDHVLSVGIRPERIHIEIKKPKKVYKNALIVKPTVCELLGGEYNVHFDFCGKDMVGSLDAKQKITTDDEIAVSFSLQDLYVFDPVTGETIK